MSHLLYDVENIFLIGKVLGFFLQKSYVFVEGFKMTYLELCRKTLLLILLFNLYSFIHTGIQLPIIYLFIESLQYTGTIYFVLHLVLGLDAVYCVEDSNIPLKFATTTASTICGKVDTVTQR